MKFPFLSKSSETTSAAVAAASVWPWPACANNPRTLSFRSNPNDANIYKTMNPAFLDDRNSTAEIFAGTPDPFPSIPDESFPCATEPAADDSAVVRGLRSDRLFFEPGETSSILEGAKSHGCPPCKKQSVSIMGMDSWDPCLDFRVSMEEMVEAHGLKDWESLEELLACYLRVNRKGNHGYIVGAFVDLLRHLAFANDITASSDSAIDEQCSSSSTATQFSFTSPLSFYSSSSTYSSISPCVSLIANEDEIIVEKNVKTSSSSSSCSSGV
ncbi:hypothetical protein OROMI_012355 [Orobanche minor]